MQGNYDRQISRLAGTERMKMFLINKKENDERIRKAAALQTGWKELMENVARWEEIEEIVIEESEENVNGWLCDDCTEEGVAEAGYIFHVF